MFRMPPEWAPHERTWMAWPGPNPTFTDDEELAEARGAWAAVARAVRRFEPVTMVVGTGQSASARELLGDGHRAGRTRPGRRLDARHRPDLRHRRLATGGRGLGVQRLGRQPTGHAGSTTRRSPAMWPTSRASAVHSSRLVNEGGAIHVDGEGTVLLTDTVQLGPERNPDWTPYAGRGGDPRPARHHQGDLAAARPHRRLRPVRHPRPRRHRRGLRRPRRGRRPHPARPVPPGPRAVPRPTWPCCARRPTRRAAAWRSSRSRPPPCCRRTASGSTTPTSTTTCATAEWSCARFDDPRDEVAAGIFRRLYPDRTVTLVDARTIFAGGGGIHCITQQQPRV